MKMKKHLETRFFVNCRSAMAGRLGLMGAGRKLLSRAGVNSAAVSRARYFCCTACAPGPVPFPAAVLRRAPGTPLAGRGAGSRADAQKE